MASTMLAFLAVAVLLLQAPWCSVAQHNGTEALMAWTVFEGEPTACDEKNNYKDTELLAALATQWLAGGAQCHKKIRITSSHNGKTVEVEVVDECGSDKGCKNNVIATSKAVWGELGLDTNIGEVPITWAEG